MSHNRTVLPYRSPAVMAVREITAWTRLKSRVCRRFAGWLDGGKRLIQTDGTVRTIARPNDAHVRHLQCRRLTATLTPIDSIRMCLRGSEVARFCSFSLRHI